MSHAAAHNPRTPRPPRRESDTPVETPEATANPTIETAGTADAAPTASATTNDAPQEATAANGEECGEHFQTKVRGGAMKDNTCTKPKGHGGPHGRVRAEIVPVATESLSSFEFVPDDERVEYGAGKSAEERSEQQKKIDNDVKTVHDEWVRRGKPTKITFNQHPRGRYFITPEEEESYRKMLRAAGRLHNVKVKMPAMQKHQSGQMMIVYAVVDLPVETTAPVVAGDQQPPESVPSESVPSESAESETAATADAAPATA